MSFESERKNMIEIGGQSSRQGIIFWSNNYVVDIKTFPNIEIGDVRLLEKSKKNNRELNIILPILIVLLVDEIFFRRAPWFIFRLVLIVAIILTIIYYSYCFGIESFRLLRINHGAEHKSIVAYRNGKVENITNVSRFTVSCGGNVICPILIMLILGDWIRYPVTLSLIYYLCYLYVRPIRNILFEIVGVPIQLITTKEPSPEILEAAKIGLLKLIEEEETLLLTKVIA